MVSDLLSSNEGGGGTSATAPLTTYTEKFEELFPFYLSIGMTEEQYWDGDCNLVKPYRKAEELRLNRRNQEMWLQGAYFYEAICRVSPVMNAFAKKGTKPLPYPSEPFALGEKQIELKRNEQEMKTYNKGKQMMDAFMHSHNKKYERSE